jgi:uncharacterized protein DUF993
MTLASYQRRLDELGTATPNRTVFAAAHIVVEDEAGLVIDAVATDAQRRFLDQHGFGIAEAMDTAQRFELGWDVAKNLIERTSALGLRHGFAAGASSDQVEDLTDITDLASAVAWQVNFIRECGGLPVILPMPQLAQANASADQYVQTYRDILKRSRGQVLLHWLGPMFLPGLEAYFPGDSFERVMDLDLERIIGIKLSLLDAEREISIRQHLALSGQSVYTGDDFHFADLIAGSGDAEHSNSRGNGRPGEFSHALLGIFDAIARPAGLALQFLSHGLRTEYFELMRPCEKLSRLVFADPTRHYKAGLAYLAYLDGRQSNPWLPQAAHLARDPQHYATLLDLGLQARIFANPGTARTLAHQLKT